MCNTKHMKNKFADFFFWVYTWFYPSCCWTKSYSLISAYSFHHTQNTPAAPSWVYFVISCYSMLTNKCLLCISTDYVLGVAHNTARTQASIANFSHSPNSTLACVWEEVCGLFLSGICLVLSKLLLDKILLPNTCVQFPSHTNYTHDFVMGVFCQSTQACWDDFQQLLSSRMDWRRLFQSSWNEPPIVCMWPDWWEQLSVGNRPCLRFHGCWV